MMTRMYAHAPTLPAAKPAQAKGTTAQAVQKPASPLRFGAGFQVNRLLKALDFQELATTSVKQVMLIYAAIIFSRFLSAIQRMRQDPLHRTNEIKETAARDPLGFTLWIFGIPVLQRLFLKSNPLIPKHYRQALVEIADAGQSTQGVMGKLRWLNRKFNPLRWSIPSREQVSNYMHYSLEKLEQAGFGKGSADYTKLHDYFEKGLLRYRNLATLLGWGVTIAMLGVGVMFFNIHSTRKRNAAKLKGQQQPTAQTPGQSSAGPGSTPSTSSPPSVPSAYPAFTTRPMPAQNWLPLQPMMGPLSFPAPNAASPFLAFAANRQSRT